MYRCKLRVISSVVILLSFVSVLSAQDDGSVLPFPETPSASKAGPSLKESTHHWRTPVRHVAEDAPRHYDCRRARPTPRLRTRVSLDEGRAA